MAYALFFDQKLEIAEVSKLYLEVIKTLFEIHPQPFFSSGLAESLTLTKEPSQCRNAIPINETYYIESNMNNVNKFERIKKVLSVFDLEDELIIKYMS